MFCNIYLTLNTTIKIVICRENSNRIFLLQIFQIHYRILLDCNRTFFCKLVYIHFQLLVTADSVSSSIQTEPKIPTKLENEILWKINWTEPNRIENCLIWQSLVFFVVTGKFNLLISFYYIHKVAYLSILYFQKKKLWIL